MASAVEQFTSNLNFGAFSKAQELKQRLWFMLIALLIYRVGTHIPLPGIDSYGVDGYFQLQIRRRARHAQHVFGWRA